MPPHTFSILYGSPKQVEWATRIRNAQTILLPSHLYAFVDQLQSAKFWIGISEMDFLEFQALIAELYQVLKDIESETEKYRKLVSEEMEQQGCNRKEDLVVTEWMSKMREAQFNRLDDKAYLLKRLGLTGAKLP